ncbi:hypothetical protein QTP88_007376 [Uroleucon formosanum]
MISVPRARYTVYAFRIKSPSTPTTAAPRSAPAWFIGWQTAADRVYNNAAGASSYFQTEVKGCGGVTLSSFRFGGGSQKSEDPVPRLHLWLWRTRILRVLKIDPTATADWTCLLRRHDRFSLAKKKEKEKDIGQNHGHSLWNDRSVAAVRNDPNTYTPAANR